MILLRLQYVKVQISHLEDSRWLDEPEERSMWSQSDSNPRHPACKAGALPTELWPPEAEEANLAVWDWEELNLRPHAYQACALTT